MPDLFGNNLKITNILLNLVAKIGNHNILILAETAAKSEGGRKHASDRVPNADKMVIYDFGVILLEVVSGRPITGDALVSCRRRSTSTPFTTLSRLPDLRVLTLTGLGLWGPLPAEMSRLAALEIVNVSGNYLYSELPEGLSRLQNLQTLIADDNLLSGELQPWLGRLPSLAVLSLRNNSLRGKQGD
ncbi:hypothetical protein EJB05_15048 [Eragrostis curvula]|uniref:Serine-threonine/tyrosine-protein kinase catalytic domain-containing protein n=1 Tax=Eragrostis curvula TaxID=38414 RepID=A0A5J9W2H3_9POAL|nr:hypothetical protein EJB05_15048 [Eragrostis curvula]